MISFDEAMRLTNTISTPASLQVAECEALYEALCQLSVGATVVEIGCDVGRSTSLIFQVAAASHFFTIHIEPWQWFPERAKDWMALMCERCAYQPFVLLRMTTEEAVTLVEQLTPQGIDLAFIDGSHDYADVQKDLAIVASRVKSGGFLAAHDYPSSGVSEAIDAFVVQGWAKHSQAMGLGIWRRN